MNKLVARLSTCLLLTASLATGGYSDETKNAKTKIVLHSKTQIFSTPHKFLKQQRVFFTLPKGWNATDLTLPDPKETPPDHWIKNWEKTCLRWKISRKDVSFKFSISMEGWQRNRRRAGAVDIKGHHGLNGFCDIPSAYEIANHDVYYFVFRLPKNVNPHIELFYYADYPKKDRALVRPALDAFVRSARIQQ